MEYYITQPKDYWIAPNAVNITLNARGEKNRVYASVASGAVIMCFVDSIKAEGTPGGEAGNGDGLWYGANHEPRRWPLTISPTYFNSDTRKYVYVAIPRSTAVGTQAVVVFPSEQLDIYGRVQRSVAQGGTPVLTYEQVGSTDYFYVWLQGIIGAADEVALGRREWEDPITDREWGLLETAQGRDEQQNSNDWYSWSAVSQTVTFLKKIVMAPASWFQNLIIGSGAAQGELNGVAKSDVTTEENGWDSHIVTPGYLDEFGNTRYLRKDIDDVAEGNIGFLNGLWIGIKDKYYITKQGIASLYQLFADSIFTRFIQVEDMKSANYTGDGMADTGWRLSNNHNGHSKLTIDELYVRMKAVFESLEVRERTYTGGDQIWSCAGNYISRTDYMGNAVDGQGQEITADFYEDGVENKDAGARGLPHTEITLPGDVIGYSTVEVPWMLRGAAMVLGKNNGLVSGLYSRYAKVRIVIPDEGETPAASRGDESVESVAVAQQQTATPAINRIRRVRCYFLAKDDDREIHNWWRINDLARCQTMNLANTNRETYISGRQQKAGNVFWWRKVIFISTEPVQLDDGKWYHFFDVAFNNEIEESTDQYIHGAMATFAMEGSDIPAATDSVVQFGNTINPGRMNLMMMEVNGGDAEVGYAPTGDAPCLKAYRGIYCFDLSKCWVGGRTGCCKMKLSPSTGYEFYGPNFKQVTEYDVVRVPVDRGLWTDICRKKNAAGAYIDEWEFNTDDYARVEATPYSDDATTGRDYSSYVDPQDDSVAVGAPVRKCYYYDKVSHNGSYWLCSIVDGSHWVQPVVVSGVTVWRYISDSAYAALTLDEQSLCERRENYTIEEPSEASQDWTMVVSKGDKGDPGADADNKEWIYIGDTEYRSTYADSTHTHPKDISRGRVHGEGSDWIQKTNQYTVNDYVPEGWSDTALATNDTTHKFVYASWREKDDVTGNWGDFVDPILWSNWGVQGTDGDGVQYVYKLFDHELTDAERTSNIPTKPASPDASGEWIPTGWDDNPLAPTENLPYCYCSVIKRLNGTWGNFETLGLWSRYSKDGEGQPDYTQTQEAWSNDEATASVYTAPATDDTAAAGQPGSAGHPKDADWHDTTPTNTNSYAYLWRRSRKMVLQDDGSYAPETDGQGNLTTDGQWSYSRLTGTNGTSIKTRGTIAVVITAAGSWPTTGITANDLGIKQGDATIWKFNGATWVETATESADGDSYTVTKDCIIDLDGDGTFNNIKGHLILWSEEAAKWIDLGQFKGDEGTTYYTHVAWGKDVTLSTSTLPIPDGQTNRPNASAVTYFSISPSEGYNWMGLLINTTPEDPTSSDKLKYTWQNTEGQQGPQGGRTGTVYLYKRSATAVSTVGIASTLYYKFVTKKLYTDAACTTEATTQLNGWGLNIPAGTDPIYVTAAIAYSETESDDIGSNEWVTPALFTGEHGINSATIFLYKRSASVPTGAAAKPSQTLYYKFSDGLLYTTSSLTTAATTELNGWSLSMPATDGNPCYIIQVAALSTESYDPIATTDWSGVRKALEDGKGQPDYIQTQEAWSNVESVVSETTEPTPNGGWSDTTPANTNNYAYLWRRSRKMVLQNNGTYAAATGSDGQWKYTRLSGTNGTSINTKGTIAVAIAAAGTWPTTGVTVNDLGIKQGDATIWKFNGATWVETATESADGDSYTVSKDCIIDLDGDGTSNNIKGHMLLWSNEAVKWIDLGQFKGDAGTTYYTHVAWGKDVTLSTSTLPIPAGQTNRPNASAVPYFSVSPLEGYKWMGILINTTPEDPTSSDKLNYTWQNTEGPQGPQGGRTGTVYLYKRSTTAISTVGIASTLYYKFSTKKLYTDSSCTTESTTQLNGWSLAIPAGTDPIYVTAAIAYSETDSDDIGTNEWVTPALFTGEHGINSATIFLYKRSASVPTGAAATPSQTLYYKFSDGKLYTTSTLTTVAATELNGWSLAMPATDGNPCYIIQAAALSTEIYDPIAKTDWSGVRKALEDGKGQPDYIQTQEAWSNDETTTNVYTAPATEHGRTDGTASHAAEADWHDTTPVNSNNYAYLWRRSRKMVLQSDGTYAPETDGQGNLTNDGRWSYARLSGTNGTSISVKGTVATVADLNNISNPQDGDAYVVSANGHLYLWSSEAGAWVDLGEFKGDPGTTYYTHIAWASAVTKGTTPSGHTTTGQTTTPNATSVTGFSVSPFTGSAWMGVLINTLSGEDSPDALSYTWNEVKGPQGDQGDPGDDGWSCVAEPANVFIEQDYNANDEIVFTPETVEFKVMKGRTSVTAFSLAAPTGKTLSNLSDEFFAARKGSSGDDAKKVLVSAPQTHTVSNVSQYYTKGSFTVVVNAVDPSDNTKTASFTVTVPCFAQMLGKRIKEAKGDMERDVATKLTYGIDPTSQEPYTLQAIGTYMSSASGKIDSVAETVTALTTANPANLFGFTKGVKMWNSPWPVLPYIQGYGIEVYKVIADSSVYAVRGCIENIGMNGQEGAYVFSMEVKASQVVTSGSFKELFTIIPCGVQVSGVNVRAIEGISSSLQYEPSTEWKRVAFTARLTRTTIQNFDNRMASRNGHIDFASNVRSNSSPVSLVNPTTSPAYSTGADPTRLFIRKLQVERATVPSVFGICDEDDKYATLHDHDYAKYTATIDGESVEIPLDDTGKWAADPTGGFAATTETFNGMQVYKNTAPLTRRNGKVDGNYRIMELSVGSMKVTANTPYTLSFWAKVSATNGAKMRSYLMCNNTGGNAYEEHSAMDYVQSGRTTASGYTNVSLSNAWRKYYVHFFAQANYNSAYAVGIRISTEDSLPSNCYFRVCGMKMEKGYITSYNRTDYETVVSQTARAIDMSVLVNSVKKAGINLTTNQEGDVAEGEINLYADRVNFKMSDGTANAKVSINPATGTLHATDGEFDGTVRARNLFHGVCIVGREQYFYCSQDFLDNNESKSWIGNFTLGDYYTSAQIDELSEHDYSDGQGASGMIACTYMADIVLCPNLYNNSNTRDIYLPRAEDFEGKIVEIIDNAYTNGQPMGDIVVHAVNRGYFSTGIGYDGDLRGSAQDALYLTLNPGGRSRFYSIKSASNVWYWLMLDDL